jgi:hypothetical protein
MNPGNTGCTDLAEWLNEKKNGVQVTAYNSFRRPVGLFVTMPSQQKNFICGVPATEESQTILNYH